jgi:hypothetical protein
MHLGFDSTGRLSSTNFDTIGVAIISLCNKSNPICYGFVSQESAIAYCCTYDSFEGGTSLLLEKLTCLVAAKTCLMCCS